MVVWIASLFWAWPAGAHDLERTLVSLTFSADGGFVLEVSNDPDWLLLRLEPFAADLPGGQVPPRPAWTGSPTAEARHARLRELAPAFVDRVVLFVDGREIRPGSVEYVPDRAASLADPDEPGGPRSIDANGPPLVTYRLTGRMPADACVLRWYYGLVVDPYPLTIRRVDGRRLTEWIVAGDAWSSALDLTGQFRAPSRWAVARQYVRLGFTHILPGGLDHVLFVLGLFLLAPRWRPVLAQVTTFTLAHSITLGLALYGVVSVSRAVVEPLIALSIAYVAVENLVTTELKPWRVALVFLFGLLHGMGFAGVLQDLSLAPTELLAALLSFNVGVEGGQLTVIAVAAIATLGFRHRRWYRRAIVIPASLAIAATGVLWTVQRLVLGS